MKKRIISSTVLAAMAIVCGLAISRGPVAQADVSEINSFNNYLSGVETMKEDNIENYYSAEGNMLSRIDSDQLEEIFEVGENIIITAQEVEQYEAFYELNGSDTPNQDAIAYAEERNALYAAAIENGYGVTDQEIQDYVNELKSILKSSMTEDEFLGIVQNFESEEKYWEYECKVYTIDLPIQNYVKSLEEAYRNESGIEDDAIFEEAWSEQFERIKKALVEKQNYVSSDEVF